MYFYTVTLLVQKQPNIILVFSTGANDWNNVDTF